MLLDDLRCPEILITSVSHVRTADTVEYKADPEMKDFLG